VILAPNQYAGLVARYNGPGDSNMYFAAIVRGATTAQAVIWRNVGGTWTQIAGNDVTATVNGASFTGTIRFEVAGPSQKLFLINAGTTTLVAFANDTAISAPGTIGLRISQSAAVDQFSADKITLTNPTLPF